MDTVETIEPSLPRARLPVTPGFCGGSITQTEQQLAQLRPGKVLAGFSNSAKVDLWAQEVQKQDAQGDWSRTSVFESGGRSIALIIWLYVDPSLFGQNYRFRANFRTIQMRTNSVRSTNWDGKVDRDLVWGSWFWLSHWWRDDAADAVPGQRGVYIFHPYFVIDTSQDLGDGYYQGLGTSVFSIGEPTYFYIEPFRES
jgi:hypothetical protein